MKYVNEIILCTSPYMIVAGLIYPFAAIIGGAADPFTWVRTDREFFAACVFAFGSVLMTRLLYKRDFE